MKIITRVFENLPVLGLVILLLPATAYAAPSVDSFRSMTGNFAEVTRNGKTVFIDLGSGRVYDSVETYPNSPKILITGKNGKSGVVRDDGKVLVNPEYDEVQLYPEGYISVKKNGRSGRFLESGEPVIPCSYTSISDGFGLTILERDGKYGWYSSGKGKIVFPVECDSLSFFYKTADFAETVKNGLHGIINVDGRIVSGPVYEKIEYFDADVFGVRKNGRWGLVKGDGKILCECRFDSFSRGDYGCAVVSEKGRYGYVNIDGKLITPLSYDDAEPFEMFLGKVTRSGKEGVVNLDGKEIVPCAYSSVNISQYPEFDPAYFRTEEFIRGGHEIKSADAAIFVTAGKKTGLLDYEGKTILPPEFESIVIFHQKNTAYISAKKNGKEGLYDASGKQVFPHEYDLFTLNIDERYGSGGRKDDPHCGGLAQMEKNGKIGIFDESMRIVIPPDFTKIEYFRQGLFLVYRDDACGMYRYDGKMIIPVKEKRRIDYIEGDRLLAEDDYSTHSVYDLNGNLLYSDEKLSEGDRLRPGKFSSGLSKLGSEREGNSFISLNGKVIRFEGYPFVSAFSDGSAVALTVDEKFGIINTAGKTILPFEYSDVSGSGSDHYVVIEKKDESGEHLGIAEKATGKIILPAAYERVNEGEQGNFFLFFVPGEERSLVGAADKNGKIIVKPECTSITPTGNGKYLILGKGDTCSACDLSGAVVIQPFKGDIEPLSRENFWPVKIVTDKGARIIDSTGKTLLEAKYAE
jgi:hypothetical protein